jgi:hypothetical protein
MLHIWENRDAYRDFGGKTGGRRLLGSTVYKWVDNVTSKVLQWEGMEGNYLAQDRDHWQAIVNIVMKHALGKIRGISWLG